MSYGQSLYTTFDDALEGLHTEPFEGPPANFYDASLRARIIVRGDQQTSIQKLRIIQQHDSVLEVLGTIPTEYMRKLEIL